MSRSRTLPRICALFLLTGCNDPTAPLPVPSTFVARTVNGTALPAPVISHEALEMVVLADTLHFYPFGVAQRISIHRSTRIGVSTTTTIDTSRVQESYEVRGDSLRFVRYCPPNALCTGSPEGVLSGDRRQLILRLWPFGPVVQYDRITP
jgi:hypothetical protein